MTKKRTESAPKSCGCDKTPEQGASLAAEVEDWLTPEELVATLRGAVSLGTLRNYRSARIGPEYVKVGRAVFYPRSEVDAWLEQQVRESQARWRDQA